MLTIHHLKRSRSERIVWLAEELGIEYKLEIIPREPTGAAPPAMRELHKIGRAPIIMDGDAVLAESGAIVEYIVHRHGGGRFAPPPSHPDYPRYLYWMHFAEGSLMSLLLVVLALSRVPEAKESPVRTRQLDRMQRMLAFVDAEIAQRPHFAGEAFTAADIMMVFPFTTMRCFLEYELAPFENIVAWLARIEERPAYRKAMAIAGPDAV